jgi:hypothetical protein
MPLPKKTVRVLPNPWAFVHHDHGPQGVCHRDTGGRGSEPAFIGAELDPVKTQITEQREAQDPRNSRQVTSFRFPALNAKLDGPSDEFKGGIELPKTPYYLDRLRDGDLVPVDRTAAEGVPCKFKSLAEARAAGVAAFEALYGTGVFAEAFPDLGKAKTTTSADSSATGAGGGGNDDSKGSKSSKGADQ